MAVQNGNAQVGGLSKTIFESLIERKVIDSSKVKVIAESKEYPEYPWTMRSDLAPTLKEKIRAAFFELKLNKYLTLAIACGLAVAKRTRLFSWYLYLGIVAMERRLCFGIFFVSCGVYHSFQCT